MTDPTPNSLSPQGEHAPPPEPLSPAAQKVLNAAVDAYGYNYSEFHCCADLVAAAALRALADQVVPDADEPDWGACTEMRCDIELFMDHQHKRKVILAIATELENVQ